MPRQTTPPRTRGGDGAGEDHGREEDRAEGHEEPLHAGRAGEPARRLGVVEDGDPEGRRGEGADERRRAGGEERDGDRAAGDAHRGGGDRPERPVLEGGEGVLHEPEHRRQEPVLPPDGEEPAGVGDALRDPAPPQQQAELDVVHHLERQPRVPPGALVGVPTDEVERADAEEGAGAGAAQLAHADEGGEEGGEGGDEGPLEEPGRLEPRDHREVAEAVAEGGGEGAADGVGGEDHVAVGEQDPGATRAAGAGMARVVLPEPAVGERRDPDHLEPRVPGGERREDLARRVGGAVVHRDDPEPVEVLREERRHRPLHPGRLVPARARPP